jgi:hypothetical protein
MVQIVYLNFLFDRLIEKGHTPQNSSIPTHCPKCKEHDEYISQKYKECKEEHDDFIVDPVLVHHD